MIRRIIRYLFIMFPPHLNIPVGFISFFASYWISEKAGGAGELSFSFSLIMGGVTSVLLMLLLRVMDELKDYETDKKLMKDRPLVTGVVTLKDLRIFVGVITAVMIGANAFLGKTIFTLFLVMLIYSYLMFVYFFYPKIKESLILAVVTHNPIVPIAQIYILGFIVEKHGFDFLNYLHILVVLMFWLPFLIWEFARKIRAPEEETDYETYSKIMGYKGAALLVIALSAVEFSLASYFAGLADLSAIFLIALAGTMIYILIKTSRFIMSPYSVPKGFKDEIELLIAVLHVGFFFALIASSAIV